MRAQRGPEWVQLRPIDGSRYTRRSFWEAVTRLLGRIVRLALVSQSEMSLKRRRWYEAFAKQTTVDEIEWITPEASLT